MKLDAPDAAETLGDAPLDRLQFALECGRMVAFDWAPDSDHVVRSPNASELLGLRSGDEAGAGREFLDAIHPDDLPAVREALRVALEETGEYVARFRFLRPADGREMHLEDRGRVVRRPDGTKTLFGVTADVTARHRDEIQIARLNLDLARRVQEFETLLDVIPIGIGIAEDREGHVIRVNPAFARSLGISSEVNASLSAPEGERPDSFRVLIEGREVPPEELPLQRAAATGEIIRDLECDVVHADGTSVRLLEFAAPLLDEHGRSRGAVGAFFDITARKQAEDRLRDTARLLQTVVASSPLAITIVDLDGTVRLWNDAAQRIFGWPAGDLIGRTLPTVPPGRLPEFLGQLRAAAEGRATSGTEGVDAEWRRRDGEPVLVSLWSAPLQDAHGRVTGVVAIGADVTGRREAERAQAQLAAIVESSDDAIIGQTLDGRISSWNNGAKRLFGYALDEVRGRPASILLPPDRPDEMARILDLVRRGGRVEHFETERVRKDGRRLAVSITVSPVRGPDGAIIGASKIARDISGRVRAEAELRKAKDDAEAANRAKDQFLAVLSHELRTPLTPVLAVVSNLERNHALSPELRRDAAMIRRNVELEARLIDDLLDLTRIARGKLKLQRAPTDVRLALKDALQASWSRDPEGKKLKLELDLRADRHLVLADGPRLTQVFWNLLNNAVKFTPDGGRVAVRSRAEGDHISIDVEDTGIGIPAASLPRIFDAFEQGQSGARDYGGLGMGLAISRAIVDLHEGEIVAQSAGPGTGARFTVRLPLLAPAALEGAAAPVAPVPLRPAPADAGPAAGRRLRVLLVEDHADTAEAMAMLLRGMGHEVRVADSVQAGRAAADEAARAGAPVQLVLSDLDLPDGTGFDLMQDLARRYGVKGIALSGFGMDDDLRRSAEAGFARHLTKPINLDVLETVIAELAAEA